MRADGTQQPVQVSWSSDAVANVTISSAGEVKGIHTGSATIRATYEALVASRVLAVVPDVEGTWTGEYRIVECTRLSGEGSSYCRFVIGAIYPFRTTLQQIGDEVSGMLELFTNTGRPNEAGPVRGRVDPGGTLVLQGTVRSTDPEGAGDDVLSDWSTRIDEASEAMSGSFVKNRTFQNFFGLQKSRERCEVLRLARSLSGQ